MKKPTTQEVAGRRQGTKTRQKILLDLRMSEYNMTRVSMLNTRRIDKKGLKYYETLGSLPKQGRRVRAAFRLSNGFSKNTDL